MCAGTGEYFPPLQFTCRNCGGGDRGRVAIYSPFGEFRRAKSHCHLYGAQGQRQAYLLPMPRSFVGLDLTTSDRWHQKTTISLYILYHVVERTQEDPRLSSDN
ncbi:hypothetical protein TNCV_4484551 [Trichonephila clavipes]|nr:hypothetical protein TNCV_4484551 [Trichonephila clavipes]